MKKLILCASAAFMTALSFQYVTASVTAPDNKETSNNTETAKAPAATKKAISVNDHIAAAYNQIDFSAGKKLNYEVFKKAYYGYMNLRNEGRVSNNKDILTVIDFSKPSKEDRMWIIDLRSKKVLINDYVAHGQGSGMDYATKFSNTSNSHQSSLGFYVTDQTYFGKHGLSLRMHGVDKGFNSAAFSRAVVVHGADYVSDAFVAGQGRLGRSWGCPAVSNQIKDRVINTIKDGTVLFIYAPQQDYLQSSHWLNKKIDQFSGDVLATN